MFELLDDRPESPERMPSSRINRASDLSLDDILTLVAFGGLVLGDRVPAPRPLQVTIWVATVAAGWWIVYRFVRRIQPIWQSEPARSPRIIIASVVGLFYVLAIIWGVAIKSDTTVTVTAVVSWGIMLLTVAVRYVRQRRRVSL